ncbi:glycosyltransferase [Allosediminivita pacifica]|uniref:Glycosyl transferase family 4 n=1 Tax=Allosediminivita pacifica TaxID=1267769 RepID=A0A2T6BA81_9RHOB|nr:glycosyltransferase [Allosediminivita pacifica]PTX52936.1 glycosyl transferase family 4 [Allosediminivita pacifica]GGA94404.1 hypothetical protein GCM10011324_01180 [Allosediminivita pacifica]
MASQASPVLAIVTRDITKYSETFIHRHALRLNGGRTVVIALAPCPAPVRPTLTLENYRKRGGVPMVLGLNALRQMRRRRLIRQFLKAQGVTHVLCEFGYVATELERDLKGLDLPVFCMFRGRDSSAQLSSDKYRAALERVLPRLDGIAAVAQFLLDNLAARGLRHPRSIVVPSGTDTEALTPGTPEQGLVFCAGRLVGKKSPLPLIRAFARVAEQHDLRLEIAGDGPETEAAHALIAELGLEKRVFLLGRMPHDALLARMRQAMIYAQHFDTPADGDTEGMPNVIQEAMACGLPIATTRHAGIPEHVHDCETGLLVEPGDELGLGDALGRLAGDGALRDRLGRAAREHAEKELEFRRLYKRLEDFMGLHGS